MIYFDNAATTMQKPPCVIDAVVQAMQNMGNAGRGAHEVSLDASRIIYDTRVRLCELFGGDGPEQVAFTANSTAALNMAIQGLLVPGDHVITTALEHNSVLRPLYRLEEAGVSLTVLPADSLGNLDYQAMEQAIVPETKAVICTHASNLTGNMIDLSIVGAICKEHQIRFLVDASQSAGVFPIDMKLMNVDVVCFTGHKGMLGPQGIGGLCVKKGVEIRPYLVGGSGVHSFSKHHPAEMPTALEAGTLNGHGIAGLNGALQYVKEQGMENLRNKELRRMWQFYDGVSTIPGVRIYGDFTSRERLRAPIVTLNIRDYDSGEVADELAVSYGISTRAGAHCAPLMHRALGTEKQGAVRFSFSHSNTEEEIERGIAAVKELAEEE